MEKSHCLCVVMGNVLPVHLEPPFCIVEVIIGVNCINGFSPLCNQEAHVYQQWTSTAASLTKEVFLLKLRILRRPVPMHLQSFIHGLLRETSAQNGMWSACLIISRCCITTVLANTVTVPWIFAHSLVPYSCLVFLHIQEASGKCDTRLFWGVTYFMKVRTWLGLVSGL